MFPFSFLLGESFHVVVFQYVAYKRFKVKQQWNWKWKNCACISSFYKQYILNMTYTTSSFVIAYRFLFLFLLLHFYFEYHTSHIAHHTSHTVTFEPIILWIYVLTFNHLENCVIWYIVWGKNHDYKGYHMNLSAKQNRKEKISKFVVLKSFFNLCSVCVYLRLCCMWMLYACNFVTHFFDNISQCGL